MSADPFETDTSADARQRLWGFAVLIAIAVIVLPLILDGAGSESKFRRVEKLREEPPRIVDGLGNRTILDVQGQDAAASVEGASDAVSGNTTAGNATVGESGKTLESGDVPLGQARPADNLIDAVTGTGNVGNNGDIAATDAANASDTTNPNTAASESEQALHEREALDLGTQQSTSAGEANSNAPGDSAVDSTAAEATASLNPDALEPGALENESLQNNLTAWVVLAGAYDQEPDALTIRDQLRNEGFASFVRNPDNPDDPFQVLVGPMIKEQGALDTLERVAKLLNGAPVVMSYP